LLGSYVVLIAAGLHESVHLVGLELNVPSAGQTRNVDCGRALFLSITAAPAVN
jgi:hypothetical protein